MRRGCGEALGFAFGVPSGSKHGPADPRIGSVKNSVWESWAGPILGVHSHLVRGTSHICSGQRSGLWGHRTGGEGKAVCTPCLHTPQCVCTTSLLKVVVLK